jgi:hypothetical protein
MINNSNRLHVSISSASGEALRLAKVYGEDSNQKLFPLVLLQVKHCDQFLACFSPGNPDCFH